MSRVIELSAVRARLSLPDDEGINDAIDSALDAALVTVENVLSTGIAKDVAEDVFFIDSAIHLSVAGLYTLRLTNGFVDKDSVVVKCAYNLRDLEDDNEEVTEFIVKAERGWIRLPADYRNSYIKAEYEHGFEEGDEVPSWLHEVVLGLTISTMSQQQINDGQAELSNVIPVIDRNLAQIMDKRLRTRSECIEAL